MSKIMVLGGYGNFGKRICELLAKDNYPFIVVGRDKKKAETLAKKFRADFLSFDVNTDFEKQINKAKPSVVINTCGPFQNSDYTLAEICIKNKTHYIDLADAREFVTGIKALDSKAKKAGVTVISGASTVPALSSAIVEKYKSDFETIDSMKFGISPGQKTEKGIATTKAILSYIGKKLKPFAGNNCAYGWQDLYVQDYPVLGKRWMANCDVPDLDLLPKKYGIRSIKFSAGMESWCVHFGIWALSWIVRTGFPIEPEKYASFLLKLSSIFDFFGSKNGGMHIVLKGKNKKGKYIERKWFIIVKNNQGPFIPASPSAILAKKIHDKKFNKSGALACVGLINVEEYLSELKDFDIKTYEL